MADEEDFEIDAETENDIADFLSQADIDSLMMGSDDGPTFTIYSESGERFNATENIHVETYDFRNPVFLTETELRQVRIRHEQFIHYLAARLSMFLRMDFSLKMSKLHTTPYAKFTESIPNPTHILLFKMEQLNGVCVMDMAPRLAMTIIDRLLGGKGHSVRDERYLTEIEVALMEDVVGIVLEEWCRQWEDILEMNAQIIGRENSGRFLQTSPSDAIMLILTMEAMIGDCSEPIQIAVPYYTVEPVIKKMQEDQLNFGRSSATKKEAHWRESYSNISVNVEADWDCFDMSVMDVLALRPGDVLEMPRKMLSQARLRLEGSTFYKGEVGIDKGRVAIKVLEDFTQDKD